MERRGRATIRRATTRLAALALLIVCGAGARSAARAQVEPTSIEIEAQPVYLGCNSILVHAPFGTAWSNIVAHFSDASSVRAIWKYNNDEQRYQAVYFPDPDALTDGDAATTAFVLSIFVCVSADGTVG